MNCYSAQLHHSTRSDLFVSVYFSVESFSLSVQRFPKQSLHFTVFICLCAFHNLFQWLRFQSVACCHVKTFLFLIFGKGNLPTRSANQQSRFVSCSPSIWFSVRVFISKAFALMNFRLTSSCKVKMLLINCLFDLSHLSLEQLFSPQARNSQTKRFRADLGDKSDVTSGFIFKHLCSPLSVALISFNYSEWKYSLYGPLWRQKTFVWSLFVCIDCQDFHASSRLGEREGDEQTDGNNKSSRHLDWRNRLIKVELMLRWGAAKEASFLHCWGWREENVNIKHSENLLSHQISPPKENNGNFSNVVAKGVEWTEHKAAS